MRLAHQFALESDAVTADSIEATEFPELASRYQVYAVPRIVLNGKHFIEGALPEQQFLDAVLGAAIQTDNADAV